MRAAALLAILLSAAAPPAAPPPASAAPPPASVAGYALTLDEAIRIALANQPQLRQARASVEAADARADQALAPMLPQLTGSFAYQRLTSNFSTRPGSFPGGITEGRAPSSWATTNYWSTGATLSQLVWDFGQAPGRWRAARASADAQRDTEVSTGLQVLLGVRTSFFTARATKDLVAVARETLANQEAHLRQIQGFVEVGVRPEIDLAQARTDRANAEVQLINAENGYATAKAQLNQAMGIEAPTDYDVSDDAFPAVEGEDLALDILLDEALGNRPDVAALASQVKAQEATLSSVRGAYWPTLGVSTGINDAGPQLSSMVWNWNATATLTWNLFQGGLTRAQANEAQANLSGLSAQVAALRQQVRLDVDKARLAVRAARAAIGAAAEALVNARERLRLAEGRYRTGAGSALELSDAQLALTSASAQRVKADYDLASARAQLLQALGRPLGAEAAPARP
jgi:outer membrane protein